MAVANVMVRLLVMVIVLFIRNLLFLYVAVVGFSLRQAHRRWLGSKVWRETTQWPDSFSSINF